MGVTLGSALGRSALTPSRVPPFEGRGVVFVVVGLVFFGVVASLAGRGRGVVFTRSGAGLGATRVGLDELGRTRVGCELAGWVFVGAGRLFGCVLGRGCVLGCDLGRALGRLLGCDFGCDVGRDAGCDLG